MSDIIAKNDLKIEKNTEKEIVKITFPSASGEGNICIKKLGEGGVERATYEYDVEIGDKKTTFAVTKTLWKMGDDNRCQVYKNIKQSIEKAGISPDFGESSSEENIGELIRQIKLAGYHIQQIFKEWVKDAVKEQSWAQVSGSAEHFAKEDYEKGRKILEEARLIDEILDVCELTVVGQRSQLALSLLISLSTFLPKSIHSISTAPPGRGKSTVSDAVFTVFPGQLKETIGKDSTPASLYNLTKYKEGPTVLSGKLIRIGDLGNEEEQKNAQEILSIFKELMSDGYISRTISQKVDENNVTIRLEIKGIGSIHLTSIEGDTKTQYSSRAIISAPQDNPEIRKAIKEHQESNFKRTHGEREFGRRRPALASALLFLDANINKLKNQFGEYEIINPYISHMEEVFRIKETSKNEYRDRNHISILPKTVTIACINQRDIWKNDETGDVCVFVTPKDYLYALKIIGRPILQMLSPFPPESYTPAYTIKDKFMDKDPEDSYTEFVLGELNWSDSYWNELKEKRPCFTKKALMNELGVHETKVRSLLDTFADHKLVYIHRRQGQTNTYFITREFLHFTDKFDTPFFSDDELALDSEIGVKVQQMYDEALQEAKAFGFKKVEGGVPRLFQKK